MKKSFFAIVSATLFLASCGTDDNGFNGGQAIEKLQNDYAESFNKCFNTPIDANHDWGFKSLKSISLGDNTKAAMDNAGVYPNYNVWPSTAQLNEPAVIGQEEISKVEAAFATATKSNAEAHFSDFFVQIVSGDFHIAIEVGLSKDKTVRINDYNSGGAHKGIVLVHDAATEVWGNHERGNDKAIDFDHNIMLKVDGGIYVGYDTNGNGHYNDFIVKITGVEYVNPESTCRIMCEDLGSIQSSDLDFNDCVIDVAIVGNTAVITVRAVGGTMPIFVGDKELHQACGVDLNTMVNTGNGSVTIDNMPNFTIDAPASLNARDIPITVGNTHIMATYDLVAKGGKAPQKIAVPITVAWPNEKQNIGSRYPKFPDYIADHNVKFWE